MSFSIPETIKCKTLDDAEKIGALLDLFSMTCINQKEYSDALYQLRSKAYEQGNITDLDNILEGYRTSDHIKDIPYKFTYDYLFYDFSETEAPYWDIFNQPDKMLKEQRLNILAVNAKNVGFTGFKQVYKKFLANLRNVPKVIDEEGNVVTSNPTHFTGSPFELDAGEWQCTDDGVFREFGTGLRQTACIHPIMPVALYTNVDTNEEKIEIAYKPDKHWQTIVISKLDAFDSSKIIKLAAYGVSVTSEYAKPLATYLCDMEGRNKAVINKIQSVTRLGFIGKDYSRFSPYVKDLIFDGDLAFGKLYSSISQTGDYEEWKKIATQCINDTITAKIVLSSAFASVLVKIIKTNPFFVHLWSVESGTGKTVALMLAASVWGNPDVGEYIQTFNSTQVGLELTAAFLNNLPLMIDEAQLSKDSHGKQKFDVYQLAQGTGRTRGNKNGGVNATPTWANCIITTGESPLTSDTNGSGAINRVIDIECKASEMIIKDGYTTALKCRQNHGYAGKEFIENLQKADTEELQQRFLDIVKEMQTTDATGKQANSAAIIILGSQLADEWIFKTGKPLTVEDMTAFMKTNATVSAGERAYSFLLDWVSANSNSFICKITYESGNVIDTDVRGEIYGKIEGDYAYINKTKFRTILENNGFNPTSVISWLKANSKIIGRGRNNTRGKRINGILMECIALQLAKEEESSDFFNGYTEIL